MSASHAPEDSAGLTQRFACHPESIEACRQAIGKLLGPLAIEASAYSRIEVVLEEIVSNVVRHSVGARWLELTALWQAGALMLSVTDDGEAFDPLAAPSPEPFTQLSNARLGGLGIQLVRDLATSLAYARAQVGEEAVNRLQVIMPAPLAG